MKTLQVGNSTQVGINGGGLHEQSGSLAALETEVGEEVVKSERSKYV